MKRNQTKKRARIVIVDDHPAVRQALAMLIGQESDLELCGEATDLSDAVSTPELATRYNPVMPTPTTTEK